MSNKKYNIEDIEDTNGPMNSVAKEDAEVWANDAAGVNYDEKQLHRIKVAKKQKAKKSSTKQDRRMSKQIISHVKEE
jgi:uncharacterized protein (UPF0335 family)